MQIHKAIKPAFRHTSKILILATGLTLNTVPLFAEQKDGKADTEKPWLQVQQGELLWLRDINLLPPKGFLIQLAVYKQKKDLEAYAQSEKLVGLKVVGMAVNRKGEVYYHLFYGPYQYRDNAEIVAQKLQESRGVETWVRLIESLQPE